MKTVPQITAVSAPPPALPASVVTLDAANGTIDPQQLPGLTVEELAQLGLVLRNNDTELGLDKAVNDAYVRAQVLAYLKAVGLLDANGLPIASGSAPANAAPTATNVVVSGTAQVGQMLTGTYAYQDAENDQQGATVKQWYRADNASGTNLLAISGATASTYTLVTADQGKYIRFSVLPVAATGTTQGAAVVSPYTVAIVAAAVQPSSSFALAINQNYEAPGAHTSDFSMASNQDSINFSVTPNPAGATITNFQLFCTPPTGKPGYFQGTGGNTSGSQTASYGGMAAGVYQYYAQGQVNGGPLYTTSIISVTCTVPVPAANWRQLQAADLVSGSGSNGNPLFLNLAVSATGGVALADASMPGQAVFKLRLPAGQDGAVRWKVANTQRAGRVVWMDSYNKPLGPGFGNKAGLRMNYNAHAQSVDDGADADYGSVTISAGSYLFIGRESGSRVYYTSPNADGTGRTVLATLPAATSDLFLGFATEDGTPGVEEVYTMNFLTT